MCLVPTYILDIASKAQHTQYQITEERVNNTPPPTHTHTPRHFEPRPCDTTMVRYPDNKADLWTPSWKINDLGVDMASLCQILELYHSDGVGGRGELTATITTVITTCSSIPSGDKLPTLSD